MYTITITHDDLALLLEGLRSASACAVASALRGDAPRAVLFDKADALDSLATDIENHVRNTATRAA